MNVDDFAAAIKSKHPEYESVDNTELTSRMLEKYPQYKSSVELPSSQPAEKQPSQLLDTAQKTMELGGTVFGGIAGGAAGSALGPAGTVAGGVAGAGLGRALGTQVGETIKRYAGESKTPSILDQFKQLGESGAQGAKDQATGEAVGAVAKPVVSWLGDAVNKGLAKLSKWKLGASVSEKGAEIAANKRFDLPKVSEGDIETGVSNVQKALTEAKDKAGKVLNEAKSGLGLPVTVEERVAALKEHGNVFGFGKAEKADIAKSFGDKYGGVSQHMPDTLKSFAMEALDNPNGYEKVIDKRLEDLTRAKAIQLPSGNTAFESVSGKQGGAQSIPFANKDIAQQFKQEVMGKLDELVSFAHPDAIKQPEQLAVAIKNFDDHAAGMSTSSRVKTASMLQDKINGMVNWDKSGTVTEGLLKNQYTKLGEFVNDEAVGMKGAKAEMAKTLKVFDDLESRLADKSKPGAAQDFLKSLFTKTSGKNQDYLNRLAQLEELSGKPVLTKLFDQFAGKEFSTHIGSPRLASAAAAEGGTALWHLNAPGVLGAVGYLGAQSPALIKTVGKASDTASKAALAALKSQGAVPTLTALKGLQSLKTNPALQSLYDKMKNKKEK